MTFGQKLKKARIEKKVTQRFLAEKMHVSYQTISKWENDINEPNLAAIRELSKLLGCSIEYLISD